MKRMRLFCVLLAAAMLLSLAACGKDDPKESNSLQIGDYALLYQLSYTPMWWAFGDSNPGPTGYEPAALTN